MVRQSFDERQHPIRAERERQGLSPEGLAAGAGISLRTLERIEAGQVRPHRSTLRVIAAALGVDPDALNGERSGAAA